MAAPSNFLLEPVPHDEAAKWIEGKPVVSREVFDELLPDLQGRAFVITGVEDANVVSDVRKLVADLPRGESWEVQKKAIVAKLGPWFDAKAADARAELLLRTHGFQAYRTHARAVMDRQSDVFPFKQYLDAGDEKVRPSHRAMNGIIAPANSRFWEDKPGGWGCRCREVALLPDEVDDIKAEDAGKPLEEQRVLEGPRLKSAEDGRLVRALRDDQGKLVRDPIHPWDVSNPDKIAVPQSLAIDPAQLKARYDETTWGEFEASAQKNKLTDGRTVWQWMSGEKAPKAKSAKKKSE